MMIMIKLLHLNHFIILFLSLCKPIRFIIQLKNLIIMPIEEKVLNVMKCCLFNDGHIAIEPILVSCGAIGCKKCLLESNIEEIDCYSCKGKHKTQDLKNTPVIKSVEDLVKSHISDLFEYVKKHLCKTTSLLEGKIERNILINNKQIIV